MGTSKTSFVECADNMTHQDKEIFAERSVFSFEMMEDVSRYLNAMGVVLLLAIVSVKIPGNEDGKVVLLGNPGMSPEELQDLLELMGKNSKVGVKQAQVVLRLAMKKNRDNCDGCPDKDECKDRR